MTSADKGDIVLVIWSDEHSNYQVYHEVLLTNDNKREIIMMITAVSGSQPPLPAHGERVQPGPGHRHCQEEADHSRGRGQGVLPGGGTVMFCNVLYL